jgi:hypothetical protein
MGKSSDLNQPKSQKKNMNLTIQFTDNRPPNPLDLSHRRRRPLWLWLDARLPLGHFLPH